MTALIEIIEKKSFNLIYFKIKTEVILAIKKRKESNEPISS